MIRWRRRQSLCPQTSVARGEAVACMRQVGSGRPAAAVVWGGVGERAWGGQSAWAEGEEDEDEEENESASEGADEESEEF